MGVADFAAGFDAEGLVDRGAHVEGGVRLRDRVAADAVGLADDAAADHAAAGEQSGLHAGPVVAARDRLPWQRGDFWRAPELAQHRHKGLVE